MDKSHDLKLDSWLGQTTQNLQQILQQSCRLCMTQLKSARINMASTERNGVRLLEIANQLTALNIAEQSEAGVALDLCLMCAGKLVHFHEFREACQKNEREFDTIVTAIQLKMKKFNHSNLENDDDVQVIYCCRTCKEQFGNETEYLEHKKIHNLTSTPSKESSRTEEPVVFNVANLSAIPNETDRRDIKNENEEFDCRHCSRSFGSYPERLQHEQEHKKSGLRLMVPPLILKKRGRKPKLRVLEAKDVMVEEMNVDVNPQDIPGAKKEFKCDKCLATFANFKAKWWHDLKNHKVLLANNDDKRKTKTKQVCRHCGAVFDRYIAKYRHEKRCDVMKAEPNVDDDEDDDVAAEDLPGPAEDDSEEFRAKCSKCPEEFSSRRGKTVHEQRVHQMDIRECRICHRMFGSYPGRYIHEKRCTGLPAQVEA